MTEPLHVLFVCTANICRSPFMELLARELADGGLEVSSAGTHGLPDHPMDPAMTVGLTRRGVAHDSFRSRPLTADLVDTADLVLTAEVAHRRLILDQQPGAFRKVFTLGQFASAVPDADGTTGRALVELVGTRRPPASASLDVDDPYRRGPERATACGDRIEALLRVVVPALTTSGRISA
ncbi:low molecular weight phosphatase family protein [Nocardioides euryhalodurans]|uniref:protein-tyrosine-phosphatase n=1 Tax=Nocardioides euryhalodurans TaxID=2518370 RepID=A0A4P7GMK9_9ACTN|nr:low molecular weight phosphatase family protein [Nocardioides euryhalodurans]QBR93398.1 low molecular weight phosphatase family protein [Nocardioides euryhalodurans]